MLILMEGGELLEVTNEKCISSQLRKMLTMLQHYIV